MRRILFRNFSWLAIDKGLRLGTTVIVTSLVMRSLGPEQMGKLQYAIALCGFLGFFANVGIDQVLITHIARRKDDPGSVLGTIITMKGLGALFCLFMASVIALLHYKNDPSYSIILILTALSFGGTLGDFSDLWFQSQNQMQRSVLGRQVGFLGAQSLRLFLVWRHAPLYWFAAAQAVETLGIATFLILNFFQSGAPRPGFRRIREEAKAIAQQGWPLFLSSLFVLAYTKGDQLILGWVRPLGDVGLYSATSRILDYFTVLPMLISTSLLPLLSGPELNADEIFRKSLRVVGWAGWVVAIAVFLFSPFIVKVLYGMGFRDCVPLLKTICWALPVIYFSVIRQAWLAAKRQLKTALYFEMIVGCLSVSLNFYLAPRWGAGGAAVSFVATSYCSNFIACLFLKPLRESVTHYWEAILPFRRTPSCVA